MAKNIIIIDDNPNNIKLASMVLQKEGYTVFSDLCVKEALKTMKLHRMHLVLMDIMMPEINGIEGVKLMKQDSTLRHIPILMVTALSSKSDVVKALQAGADDYLVKPYNIKNLVVKTKSLTNISAFIEKWCPNNTITEHYVILD